MRSMAVALKVLPASLIGAARSASAEGDRAAQPMAQPRQSKAPAQVTGMHVSPRCFLATRDQHRGAALWSDMGHGLTITRLPAPLLLTAANCLPWGDQQSERQPRSAGELRTVQLKPSALVMIRLPVPLLATATSSSRWAQQYDQDGNPKGPKIEDQASADALPRNVTIGFYGPLSMREGTDPAWIEAAEQAYRADETAARQQQAIPLADAEDYGDGFADEEEPF